MSRVMLGMGKWPGRQERGKRRTRRTEVGRSFTQKEEDKKETAKMSAKTAATLKTRRGPYTECRGVF